MPRSVENETRFWMRTGLERVQCTKLNDLKAHNAVCSLSTSTYFSPSGTETKCAQIGKCMVIDNTLHL